MLQDKRDEIVAAARALLKTAKFRFKGRTDFGVDCYGLPYVVARNVGGLLVPDLQYNRDFEGGFFKREFYRIFASQGKGYRAPGSIVAFRQEGRPCHMAILTERWGDDWKMVHANLRAKKVSEDLLGSFAPGGRGIITVADFRTK